MAQQQGGRASPDEITDRIVDAILAGASRPASAWVSNRWPTCSASAARWCAKRSREEAKEAFDARIAIETGMLQGRQRRIRQDADDPGRVPLLGSRGPCRRRA